MFTFRGGIFPRLIALFPLLFPLYLFRGNIFGLSVTLPEVALFFAVLYFVFRERIWESSWWREHGRSFIVWPVFIFLAAAIIGVLISPRLSYFVDGSEFYGLSKAAGIFKGWILAPVAYFYMARYFFKEKPSLIETSLRSLLAGGVLLALYALYQVVTGDYITADLRASGPFESANYLALYLGPIFIYALYSSFDEKRKAEKIVMIFSALICAAALYFTKSYASWIAVFVSVSISFLLFLRTQSKRTRTVSAACILLILGALLFSQIDTGKFAQFLDLSNRSSSSVRVQVYEVAWKLMRENPLFGIGLGQFEQVYQINAVRILNNAPFEWVMIHPHNLYLALWLNVGFAGLASILFLVWRALKWMFEKDSKKRQIVAMMLIVILTHGLFDTPVFKNDLAFEFWLFLAMLI
ncbi:O-antigen ligase family protein [Candidatus Peregrinibacteria bacterium]|nr:O-antigen ligase family protein [Candidatus Peregrinibacteria bacterium]